MPYLTDFEYQSVSAYWTLPEDFPRGLGLNMKNETTKFTCIAQNISTHHWCTLWTERLLHTCWWCDFFSVNVIFFSFINPQDLVNHHLLTCKFKWELSCRQEIMDKNDLQFFTPDKVFNIQAFHSSACFHLLCSILLTFELSFILNRQKWIIIYCIVSYYGIEIWFLLYCVLSCLYCFVVVFVCLFYIGVFLLFSVCLLFQSTCRCNGRPAASCLCWVGPACKHELCTCVMWCSTPRVTRSPQASSVPTPTPTPTPRPLFLSLALSGSLSYALSHSVLVAFF